MGGETADVGDVVRTIAVNGTMTARWPKDKLITNEKIKPGDVIVGLAGFGQCNYEKDYNSGIASNGLTSARHDLLNKFYATEYKETYDNLLADEVSYIGPYRLTDEIAIDNLQSRNVGQLLLSPTRTFAPIIKEILTKHFDAVNGLIHCSGGGQTKCLKYIPDNVSIVKDNLFEPPVIFQLIQQARGADDKEMYQVFNMGTRLEIYTNEKDADKLIGIAKSYGVEAKVIGRVGESQKRELIILTANNELRFDGDY
jgi:phosphoribosylformylglycinamidine cyclo-ligase